LKLEPPRRGKLGGPKKKGYGRKGPQKHRQAKKKKPFLNRNNLQRPREGDSFLGRGKKLTPGRRKLF